MKLHFALVNGTRRQPWKGGTGTCPCCGSELIAKCGEVKVHHWAHKSNRQCDLWWENQTEWHRAWKNAFPPEWQEILIPDPHTGERHIADVRTPRGLVIEFQHSHLDPQERAAREKFYKNMVWILDCTRLRYDYKRFLRGKEEFRNAGARGIYFVCFADECFPSAWLRSSVPVFFDFRGNETITDSNDPRHSIYCLLPKQVGRDRVVLSMTHNFFVGITVNNEWSTLMNTMNDFYKAWQSRLQMQQRQEENAMIARFMRRRRFRGPGRRF